MFIFNSSQSSLLFRLVPQPLKLYGFLWFSYWRKKPSRDAASSGFAPAFFSDQSLDFVARQDEVDGLTWKAFGRSKATTLPLNPEWKKTLRMRPFFKKNDGMIHDFFSSTWTRNNQWMVLQVSGFSTSLKPHGTKITETQSTPHKNKNPSRLQTGSPQLFWIYHTKMWSKDRMFRWPHRVARAFQDCRDKQMWYYFGLVTSAGVQHKPKPPFQDTTSLFRRSLLKAHARHGMTCKMQNR